jgi:phospho-N-acetylmuramoyl-pentapeptide-transferase
MPKFITWAKQKATQPIYELAPKSHQQKSKTPTMGGVIFLGASFIALLFTIKFHFYTFIAILTMILFMSIGFIDDKAKILGNSNHAGLTPKQKFILQWLFAFIISILLYISGFNTEFYIPFDKDPLFNMGLYKLE